jgi:hypothetical protein
VASSFRILAGSWNVLVSQRVLNHQGVCPCSSVHATRRVVIDSGWLGEGTG